MVVITHDRVLPRPRGDADRRARPGILASFRGVSATTSLRKADQLDAEGKKANARFDKLLAQKRRWIRKGVEARRTRNEGRCGARGPAPLSAAPAGSALATPLASTGRRQRPDGGRAGATSPSASASAPSCAISPRASCAATASAMIGPNGAGKTTLLKLILGGIEPDEGRVRRGTRQTVAYFDQLRAQLDPEAPLTG